MVDDPDLAFDHPHLYRNNRNIRDFRWICLWRPAARYHFVDKRFSHRCGLVYRDLAAVFLYHFPGVATVVPGTGWYLGDVRGRRGDDQRVYLAAG